MKYHATKKIIKPLGIMASAVLLTGCGIGNSVENKLESAKEKLMESLKNDSTSNVSESNHDLNSQNETKIDKPVESILKTIIPNENHQPATPEIKEIEPSNTSSSVIEEKVEETNSSVIESIETAKTETKIIESIDVIPFNEIEAIDYNMLEGETRVVEGVNGEEKLTYNVYFKDNVEIGKKLIDRTILSLPKNKIIYKGGKSKSETSSINTSSPSIIENEIINNILIPENYPTNKIEEFEYLIKYETSVEDISFKEKTIYDNSVPLNITTRKEGKNGSITRIWEIVFSNNKEISRKLIEETKVEPEDSIITIGNKPIEFDENTNSSENDNNSADNNNSHESNVENGNNTNANNNNTDTSSEHEVSHDDTIIENDTGNDTSVNTNSEDFKPNDSHDVTIDENDNTSESSEHEVSHDDTIIENDTGNNTSGETNSEDFEPNDNHDVTIDENDNTSESSEHEVSHDDTIIENDTGNDTSVNINPEDFKPNDSHDVTIDENDNTSESSEHEISHDVNEGNTNTNSNPEDLKPNDNHNVTIDKNDNTSESTEHEVSHNDTVIENDTGNDSNVNTNPEDFKPNDNHDVTIDVDENGSATTEHEVSHNDSIIENDTSETNTNVNTNPEDFEPNDNHDVIIDVDDNSSEIPENEVSNDDTVENNTPKENTNTEESNPNDNHDVTIDSDNNSSEPTENTENPSNESEHDVIVDTNNNDSSSENVNTNESTTENSESSNNSSSSTSEDIPTPKIKIVHREVREDLDFKIIESEDPELAEGERIVDKYGQKGYVIKTYEDTILVDTEEVQESKLIFTDIVEPINQKVRVGTKKQVPGVIVSEEYREETVENQFTTEYIYDNTLPVGYSNVEQKGRNEIIKKKYKITKINGSQVAEDLISSKTEQTGITEKIRVGTAQTISKIVVERIEEDFEIERRPDNNLEEGKERTAQEGQKGVFLVNYEVKTLLGEEISKKELSRTTQTPKKNKIILYGTKKAPTSRIVDLGTMTDTIASQGLRVGDILPSGAKITAIRINNDLSIQDVFALNKDLVYSRVENTENTVVLEKEGDPRRVSIGIPMTKGTQDYINENLNLELLNKLMLEKVNELRKQEGKSELIYAPHLQRGVTERALEQANLFNLRSHDKPHTRPDGTKFNTAFTYLNNEQFTDMETTVGENIAQFGASNFYKVASEKYIVEQLFKQWLRSPAHKSNMLSDDYKYFAFDAKVGRMNDYVSEFKEGFYSVIGAQIFQLDIPGAIPDVVGDNLSVNGGFRSSTSISSEYFLFKSNDNTKSLVDYYNDINKYEKSKDKNNRETVLVQSYKNQSKYLAPFLMSNEAVNEWNKGTIFNHEKFQEEFIKLLNQQRKNKTTIQIDKNDLSSGNMKRMIDIKALKSTRVNNQPHLRTTGESWISAFRSPDKYMGENVAELSISYNPYEIVSEKAIAERVFKHWSEGTEIERKNLFADGLNKGVIRAFLTNSGASKGSQNKVNNYLLFVFNSSGNVKN